MNLLTYLGRALCTGAIAIFCVSFDAAAQLDDDTLWTRLALQSQASGRFSQEILGDDDEVVERSNGRYAVLRPGFFRWEIEEPDRQILLLKNADLWHYDVDLATVTRRDTEGQEQFTPLELLSGDSAALRARFDVEALANDRYRLLPLFAQAGFSSLEILWQDGEIVAMDIRDRSGQLIRIRLDPDPEGSVVQAQDFELDLPPDVEIYDASRS